MLVIDETLAKSAMRLILSSDDAIEECGLRNTGENEWMCWMDTYELTVKVVDREIFLMARCRTTRRLSIVCTLRMIYNSYNELIFLPKRKLSCHEIRRMSEYLQ